MAERVLHVDIQRAHGTELRGEHRRLAADLVAPLVAAVEDKRIAVYARAARLEVGEVHGGDHRSAAGIGHRDTADATGINVPRIGNELPERIAGIRLGDNERIV